MKFLSFKGRILMSIMLLLALSTSIFSSALSAGTIQIKTKSTTFGGNLTDEIKIPFEVIIGGTVEKLTLEASSASKEMIPANFENLYLTSTGSSIKINPLVLTNVSGRLSGTIFAKASKAFISKNTSGKTTISLTAKTNKNQIAKLTLNLQFNKKVLTYTKPFATFTLATGDNPAQTTFVGYIYPTDGFTQGLTAADFALDNQGASSTSTDTSGTSVNSTPSPTPTPKVDASSSSSSSNASSCSSSTSCSTSEASGSTSSSSSEASSSSGTGSTGESNATTAQILTLLSTLIASLISFITYFLKELRPV